MVFLQIVESKINACATAAATGVAVASAVDEEAESGSDQEEKAYDDYMTFRNDPDKWARYFRVQKMISHLNRVERARDMRLEEEEREAFRLKRANRQYSEPNKCSEDMSDHLDSLDRTPEGACSDGCLQLTDKSSQPLKSMSSQIPNTDTFKNGFLVSLSLSHLDTTNNASITKLAVQ